MKPLLVIYRTLAFCLLTAGFYSLWVVGLLFVLGNETRQYQWRNWGFRNWAKAMLVALGINLNVEGISPATPCLLVTNHLSYLDIIILAARFDCVFVAKSEVANWPIIGFICQSMATIFIDRNRQRDILRVNQLIENALLSGKSVMFFPEGTTTAGANVLPFKSALFEPAVRTRTPVVVASLSYQTMPTDEDAAWSVCWWGEMKFVPHLLGVFGLREIHAQINFGAKSLRVNNRKQLAKAAEREVRSEKSSQFAEKKFAVFSSQFAVDAVHSNLRMIASAYCEPRTFLLRTFFPLRSRMQPLQVNYSTEVLIAENIKHLRAVQKLLTGLEDHVYTVVDAPMFASSIGAQLRHCLDFYQSFLVGLRTGKIDYDQRERDEVTENSRFRAIQRIEETTERLWKLSPADEQIELSVKQDSPYWGISSVPRELQFLLSHLVHHQALIAVMLRVQGVVPAKELGVAPATLENWKRKNMLREMVSRRPRLSVVF